MVGLSFTYINIIDFWLIRFITIKIKDTKDEKLVRWLKNDKDESWYQYLCFMTFILILKYLMLQIGL